MNSIPRKLDSLEALAARAEAGARSLAAEVRLKQNTADAIRRDKEALFGQALDAGVTEVNSLIGKRAEYAQYCAETSLRLAEAHAADVIGRDYCSRATDVLRPIFGRRWNSNWMAAGFQKGSLARPKDPLSQLALFRAYFRRHPEHENGPLRATADEADATIRLIEVARSRKAESATRVAAAKQARAGATHQLRRRLTALRHELSLLLQPEDPRWVQFGFHRPVDSRMPDSVEHVTVEPIGPGAVIVQWESAPRAKTYRLSRQIIGVDSAPEDLGLFADTGTLITDLPSGATVRILVTARNSTGETQPTEAQFGIP